MSGCLAKVKKKMSIYAKRRVTGILSGNYLSVFKGRSMDFDDLRMYQYGDDVKDIDWKATARSKSPMIRRYIAVRKHNIMIVADAGRSMAAQTPSGESKIKVATFSAGVISYLALKNNDLVGMIYGNSDGSQRFALREKESHIENFLGRYLKSVSSTSGKSSINDVLNYVLKNCRERMFLIIITDGDGASNLPADLVRKLRARHEQMLIIVEDSTMTNPDLANSDVYDVTDSIHLPRYLRKNRKLREAEETMRKKLYQNISRNFRRLGICSSVVSSTETAIPAIIKMLEEQKHVRR